MADLAPFIANLSTEMAHVRVGPHVLPLTRNDGGTTCYVCSPSAAYIDYGRDELRHFAAHPLLKFVLAGVIEMARPLVWASGLDRQVQPNNWLMSTNLLPDLTVADIAAATRDLTKRWPDHAVVWRSVDDTDGCERLRRFAACGYHALPARQIYLFDARLTAPKPHRDEKNDARLLDRDDYLHVPSGDIRVDDFPRMAALYAGLYLEKYSQLNPHYTEAFLREAHRRGVLDFSGFRNRAGRLDAFIAFHTIGRQFTAPLCGYDADLPRDMGLYRRLMALCLRHAREQRLLYNMSVGVAAFKRSRGGVVAVEYMLVYDRHLAWRRRAARGVMETILKALAVPLLRGFAL